MSSPPPIAEHARSIPPAVMARHRAGLWRYLRVLGADGATADDLAQEAMLVALRRATFSWDEPGRPFAFLRRTARHLWLKDARRRQSRREVEQADEVWLEECGDAEHDEYLGVLRSCVEDLPPRSRELLRWTYERAAGRAATGRALGLSEDGVKSALRRVRQALFECITRKRRIGS